MLRSALAAPQLARSVFAYLHNVVALVVWLVLFRRSRKHAVPAVVLTVACALLLFSGVLFGVARLDVAWAHRMADEAFLAVPLTVAPRTVLGIALSFVFLQAVHYAVWLTWIPQEDLRAEGTTTFAMSLRAVKNDLGLPLLGLTAVAMLGIAIAAVFAVHATRISYLSVATFHGYLELAALAYLTTRE